MIPTLIIIDFHLCPLRHATVANISSISPWRQFLPSIAEMDAMFPAPKASALPGKSTSKAIATRSTWFADSPIVPAASNGTRVMSQGEAEEVRNGYSRKERITASHLCQLWKWRGAL
jgi:hypothetical protein